MKKPSELKRREKSVLSFWIDFCPFCGERIDHQKMESLDSKVCLNCNQDLNSPFKKKNKNVKEILICNDCEQLNPPLVSFCWRCGSKKLEIDEKRVKDISQKAKLAFFQTKQFLYVLSFIVAMGIALGMLGIASRYIVPTEWVFVIILLSFTLILWWFVYVIIRYILSKR